MNVLPNSLPNPSLSLPTPSIHMHRKKHRGRRMPSIAAGIAGGSAVALIAYRKRHSSAHAVTDSSDAISATGESNDLRRHVADMVALDREMVASLRKQLDGDVTTSLPAAAPLLRQAAEAFDKQAEQLEDELGGVTHGPSAMMKKLLAMMVGAVAPLVGATRSEPVSRLLRDDVVGLHMAAVSASMLETAAKAEHQGAIASIARDGSESFALLADELQNVLPDAVTLEVEQRQEQEATASSAGNGSDDTVDDRRMGDDVPAAPAYAGSNGVSPSA